MDEQSATEVEKHASFVLVRVRAERLDERNLAAVSTEVAAAAAESPQLPVAVDLGQVQFMPSVSLGGLIQMNQKFRSRQQRLALVNMQPSVRETLMVTRLDRLLETHQDLAAFERLLS